MDMEDLGAVLVMALVVTLPILGLILLSDGEENLRCEKAGYATEIEFRGQQYCVDMEDGIIARMATLKEDHGEWYPNVEFKLIEVKE